MNNIHSYKYLMVCFAVAGCGVDVEPQSMSEDELLGIPVLEEICDPEMCNATCEQAGLETGEARYGLCEENECVCRTFFGGGGGGGGGTGSMCRGSADCPRGQVCNLATRRCEASGFVRGCSDTFQCDIGQICAVENPNSTVGRCCNPLTDLTCPISSCENPPGFDPNRVVYCF